MSDSSRVQVYPEPTVGALIVNGEGKILLARSHKWFGKYTLLGGHIELGETAEEAVRREVREEVGLDVEVGRLLLMQEAINTAEFWKKRHYIFLDYLCRAKDHTVKIDQDEIQDYTWAYPGAALNMDLDTFTNRTVSKYLEGSSGTTGLTRKHWKLDEWVLRYSLKVRTCCVLLGNFATMSRSAVYS